MVSYMAAARVASGLAGGHQRSPRGDVRLHWAR